MILIAHRGNLSGPNPADENNPSYIEHALLDTGVEVEIDVWLVGSEYFLGHDGPTTRVGVDFLTRDGLWCHAKNVKALAGLQELGCHTFFHDTDDVTLTSRGFLWTYPGKELTRFSIDVLPERAGLRANPGRDWTAPSKIAAGVCSDYVADWIF